MKYFTPSYTTLNASRIAQGCMRIAGMSDAEIDRFIKTALDSGINFFDHADIYGGGQCEEKFGKLLRRQPALREKMIIQTKCGIIIGKGYDFRPEYIAECVEGSLKRLGAERIDILLLHRPDALMLPEEVAGAFDKLEREGKVRYFGVSNHNPYQIELLKMYCAQPLVFNQLQFSPVHCGMIDCGMHVNMTDEASAMRDGMVLDYCRLNGITIQPWSPLSADGGSYIGNPAYAPLNAELERVGKRYGITPAAAAISWILRHPANMQPIVGTTNPERVAQIAKAADVYITHGEWYDVYRAAGHTIP